MPSPRLFLPGLVPLTLTLALLACTFSGGIIGPTGEPQFQTATPGGSISVSLLTTTPTAIVAPGQITTPIAPVATATALYLAAAAQTATAGAPTPTIPSISGAPSACPAPGQPALPVAAPLFSRYAEIIAKYLSAGGAPTLLEASLRTWGAITGGGGLVRADRDFTGDGAPEVFVVALDPAYANRDNQPGDLFIYGCEKGAYRLLFDAGYSPTHAAPVLQSADDLTGDGINDMIYSINNCGLSACIGEVHIIGWNAALGNFTDLTAEPITAYQPSVVVSDPDHDGKNEVSVTSGLNPDPAAGPQRQVTTVYQWNGAQFAAIQAIKSPLQYRIHAIYDGDDAMRAGDYKTAVDSYQTAIKDQELQSWGGPDEVTLLTAFARFRLMLAYVLANNVPQAQAAHDDLLNSYALLAPPTGPDGQPLPTQPAPGPQPGLDFARMADLFWQNFSVNRDAKRACDAVTTYALSGPPGLIALNTFGYGNRMYQPPDMCPIR